MLAQIISFIIGFIVIVAVAVIVIKTSKSIRNTPEGEEMKKEGQKAWLTTVFGEWMSAGDEALEELMTMSTRVGMTRTQISEFFNLLKQSPRFQNQPFED